MKEKKKFILITLGIIGTILLVAGITYAYWILTKEQTGENVVNSACLNITFTGENDINLPKAYPMTDEQLDKFLSTATPYHFTITNECDDLANVTINLESLNAGEEKQLEDQYIDAVLYKENYKANLFKNKKLTEDVLNDENKVIKESLHAYKLYSFTLKQNEEKEFNLQLYLDQDTPRSEETMNASWKGKITLSSEYKEDRFRNSGTLGTISSLSANKGLWSYYDKITNLYIESRKEDKEALDGQKKYGPFDESVEKNSSVQSYVICDSNDTNCIGYLQGDGGIKLNKESGSIFFGFSKLNKIEGLENLDASNVEGMSGMFGNCSSLYSLDLSTWDMKNAKERVTTMFSGMESLITLNLSNWVFTNAITYNFTNLSSLENLILENVDTTQMTTMTQLFSGLKSIKSIDISYFNTANVETMSYMFSGCSNLQKIIGIEKLNTSKVTTMHNMFNGCSSLLTLDLSNFDTSKVDSFRFMFQGASNLQSITFGPKFVHNQGAITTDMFDGCASQDRPTGDSWSGVSF